MKKPDDMDVPTLLDRLAAEVKIRQQLQQELIAALKTQRSLRQEIRLLRELLTARSLPEFVAFKALRKAQNLTNQGPRTFARRAYKGARRRAGAAKKKILPNRNE